MKKAKKTTKKKAKIPPDVYDRLDLLEYLINEAMDEILIATSMNCDCEETYFQAEKILSVLNNLRAAKVNKNCVLFSLMNLK